MISSYLIILAALSSLTLANDCPDGRKSCPEFSTCCKMTNDHYGCCPYQNATCCEDRIHCCPDGAPCDSKTGKCLSPASKLTSRGSFLAKLVPNYVMQKNEIDLPNSFDIPQYEPPHQDCLANETSCLFEEGDSSKVGCCPHEQGVCCPGVSSCCPNGYLCDPIQGTCHKKSSILIKPPKVTAAVTSFSNLVDNLCPDGQKSCPSDGTCCPLNNGKYSCCPLSQATCCKGGIYCCPFGYICGSGSYCYPGDSSKLLKATNFALISKKETKFTEEPTHVATIQANGTTEGHICPDFTFCSSGETCCPIGKDKYGCCPFNKGTCCADMIHCCPEGHVCSAGNVCQPAGANREFNVIDSFPKSQPAKAIISQIREKNPSTPKKLLQKINAEYDLPISVGFLRTLLPSKVSKFCPDKDFQCPDDNTCCLMKDTDYGCCPYANGTCCKDLIHCCPSGYDCLDEQMACKRRN